jgi:hypothetical protein
MPTNPLQHTHLGNTRLMNSSEFLKPAPLSSPLRIPRLTSRSREFGCFAKKPSKFLEITNLYTTSKPYSKRVYIFLQTFPLTKLYFYLKKWKMWFCKYPHLLLQMPPPTTQLPG